MRSCSCLFLGLVLAAVLPGCTQAPPWVEGDEASVPVVFAGQLAEGSAFTGDAVEAAPAVTRGPAPGGMIPAMSAASGGPVERRAASPAWPFQTPY